MFMRLNPSSKPALLVTESAKPEDIRFNTDTTDWDGDGNVTEGIAGEIQTLSDALYAQIQTYATEKPMLRHRLRCCCLSILLRWMRMAMARPIRMIRARLNYNGNWTPKLLRAAFNYQYTQKDPGAFVHNPEVCHPVPDRLDCRPGR